MLNKHIMVPDRQEIIQRLYMRQRDRFLASDFAIYELDHLVYPAHQTAYVTLSKVPDPDVVVIYSYGGNNPHHFYRADSGLITDRTTGQMQQFTYEWMNHWLDNGIAVVIFDVPDYFVVHGQPWVNSFYRKSKDRLREARQLIDIVADRFRSSRVCWAGLSYGAQEAAMVSLEPSRLHKVASISGTWHVIPDVDEFYQGVRLDWYSVEQSCCPVLIVMHEKETFEKAQHEMTLTDSILVTNDVSAEDGHFFRERQAEVVRAICDWFRDKNYPPIIP